MISRGSILLVGPDGSGKSTIAARVINELQSASISVVHAHWHPGILLPRGEAGRVVTEPHAREPRGIVGSLAKLGVTFLDFAAGHATVWRRARRNGVLLVERGWHDQLVDPRRYRLHPSVAPVVSALGAMLPKPDRVVVLSGDPTEVAQRKQELSEVELSRQQRRWLEVGPSAARSIVELDTSKSDVAACAALVTADLQLTEGWRSIPGPSRLDLRVSPGGSSTSALSIYRPSHAVARLRHRCGVVAASARLTRSVPAPIPELDQLWRTLSICPEVVASMRSQARARWVLGVSCAGSLGYVVKIGEAKDDRLTNEAEFLSRVRKDAAVEVPELEWFGEWNDRTVVVTRAIKPLRGTVDLATARDLATAIAVGGPAGRSLVHGDFTSWNVLSTLAGPVVIDWEAARAGPDPLFDLAHFMVQEGSLLRRLSPASVADNLVAPDSHGWRHLEDTGEDPTSAREHVRRYLSQTWPADPELAAFRVAVQEAVS